MLQVPHPGAHHHGERGGDLLPAEVVDAGPRRPLDHGGAVGVGHPQRHDPMLGGRAGAPADGVGGDRRVLGLPADPPTVVADDEDIGADPAVGRAGLDAGMEAVAFGGPGDPLLHRLVLRALRLAELVVVPAQHLLPGGGFVVGGLAGGGILAHPLAELLVGAVVDERRFGRGEDQTALAASADGDELVLVITESGNQPVDDPEAMSANNIEAALQSIWHDRERLQRVVKHERRYLPPRRSATVGGGS
ncbi:hypothetical protein ACFVVA_40240 [Kitasatospora sp. NPDC058048]|uniref:hypothetical protein n=1 Tax=Kitasatospora sp. NPDC058048 TaxID=3346313 RepID=UPI0036DD9735